VGQFESERASTLPKKIILHAVNIEAGVTKPRSLRSIECFLRELFHNNASPTLFFLSLSIKKEKGKEKKN